MVYSYLLDTRIISLKTMKVKNRENSDTQRSELMAFE